MLKGLFYIVIVMLAVVGFATILWFALPSTSMKENKPDYVSLTPSPNGNYKAVLSTWAGGGAISPYCYDRLTVVPTGVPANSESASDMAVFESECATFPLRDGAIENSPSIHWESDTRLKVKFSIDATARLPATVKLRKQDASGRIAVEFDALP